MDTIRGLSLFANVGIGEFLLEHNCSKVRIVLANEFLTDRARFYKRLHPCSLVIKGDIMDANIFNRVVCEALNRDVGFILATPPCQGMSSAAPLRDPFDPRNTLIKYVINAVERILPRYVVIENVGNMAHTDILIERIEMNIVDYVIDRFGSMGYYTTVARVNAANYGMPQDRRRLFILASKDYLWNMPRPTSGKHITLREAIGHLPMLESGQHSGIPWHFVSELNPDQIRWLRHTPTGETAFNNLNPEHRPTTIDLETGVRRDIRAFPTSFRRQPWSRPAGTITMANGSMGDVVHPGRLLPDGTWSDARPFTVREISILTGLPETWLDLYPERHAVFNERFFRHVIGESVSPQVIKTIVDSIP